MSIARSSRGMQSHQVIHHVLLVGCRLCVGSKSKSGRLMQKTSFMAESSTEWSRSAGEILRVRYSAPGRRGRAHNLRPCVGRVRAARMRSIMTKAARKDRCRFLDTYVCSLERLAASTVTAVLYRSLVESVVAAESARSCRVLVKRSAQRCRCRAWLAIVLRPACDSSQVLARGRKGQLECSCKPFPTKSVCELLEMAQA